MFEIITASGGVAGQCTTTAAELPALAGGKRWLIDYQPSSVMLKVLPGFEADFDEDGDVDRDDLGQWRSDFGINGESDADNDGDSDGADFLAWQQQLGSGASGAATDAVPEPVMRQWLILGTFLALSAAFRGSSWG
jgi:hypothetical protein